ncbi:efflux RND transporter periplasmic adaptor subunit [Niveibacterium sp. 24ML]|uniref:efflux RND transporter periplasmic adaptor subunit n=1 Tax=Niveibacterium sp. 24ML TaxID=2985512 RepID=UPI002271C945|nr:efflux RND transporter periplasmic adaptor subunit [Niveibacterium sp. 24ML]MCX9158506.1 efflux RND transporter periplasmic adaptor subunit [Niveibacterium sp. 24ML]
MKRSATLVLTALALAAALGAGYWFGQRHAPATQGDAASTAAPASTARKLLYYRNPMGLPDTSPVPKRDPMGMDYIAVYEGDDTSEGGEGQIRISPENVQKLGVRTVAAESRVLERSVRALGRIEIDERRVVAIAPRFEGWVERLLVNATGQPVARGQLLFEAYSPELVSAQREYAIAARGAESLAQGDAAAQTSMRALADASLARLKNWEVSDAQIKELTKQGDARRMLGFRSPVAGVVMEKKALQGMRFMPGDTLFQIADLSSVWAIVDVNEQDIAAVQTGRKAVITLSAYPGKSFEGTVSYIYPTLSAETRTVPVRVELANPQGLLKPGLFASMVLGTSQGAAVVNVPTSAVIDSGTRQIVLVQRGEGRFESRNVKLGASAGEFVEVLEGVQAGEPVVVSANFLLDAESNLKAAVQGLSAAPAASASPAASPVASGGVGHHGKGRIDAIDPASGELTLTHEPIASLKWPAMTMDFVLANSALAKSLKAGDAVQFDFVERKPGEWVVTKIAPEASAKATPAADPHAGH